MRGLSGRWGWVLGVAAAGWAAALGAGGGCNAIIGLDEPVLRGVDGGTSACEEGMECDDGDPCTTIDVCQGGVCVGGNRIQCCDPQGTSSDGGIPWKEEGAPCDDGNACTAESTCQANSCVPTITGGDAGADGKSNAWAHWVPEGQKKYVVDGEEVIDTATGKIWRRTVDSAATSDEADSVCGTHGSLWRLPTRIELISIVDYGRSMPATDVDAFPGTPSECFWTSSSSIDADGRAYVYFVHFDTGRMSVYRYINNQLINPMQCSGLYVRCVR